MIRAMKSFLLAALLLGAAASSAHAEADHGAIARAALSEVIRPGYADLARSTASLDGRVDALCKAPSTAGLDAAKEAFAATVMSWSRVEIFRFGPVIKDHRYARLFYWPDAKGIGLRQVKRVLAERNETATSRATLAKKSVALQGLPALEYLLYGPGAESLAKTTDDDFRCRFATAITANMASIAKEVEKAWGADAVFTKDILEPGPNDPLYRAPKDVTLELFKVFTSGIELVRDQKLGRPLGVSIERARPRLAALWRSGLSFQNMAGNLEGVRRLFIKGGFAHVVGQESSGVEGSILFDIDHSIEVLRAIDAPIADAVHNEELRAKIEAIRGALKSARTTAASMIERGAGLSFGFNAMDGD
jgi:predicted lipoprotein